MTTHTQISANILSLFLIFPLCYSTTNATYETSPGDPTLLFHFPKSIHSPTATDQCCGKQYTQVNDMHDDGDGVLWWQDSSIIWCAI